jgi:hypothetical protein
MGLLLPPDEEFYILPARTDERFFVEGGPKIRIISLAVRFAARAGFSAPGGMEVRFK